MNKQPCLGAFDLMRFSSPSFMQNLACIFTLLVVTNTNSCCTIIVHIPLCVDDGAGTSAMDVDEGGSRAAAGACDVNGVTGAGVRISIGAGGS